MNKKSISLATLGIVSSALMGCSNQVESIQPLQQNQSNEVTAQSNLGLSNMMKNLTEMVFTILDKDKDGFLTLKEYTSSPNSNSEENQIAFKKLDKDNDGKISLEDAKALSKTFLSKMTYNKEKARESVQKEFTRHDSDKNTLLNESEFINSALKQFDFYLNDQYNFKQIARQSFIFESSDKNHDNKITFSEYEDFYYNMMTGIMKASLLGSTSTTPTPSKPDSNNTTPGFKPE